MNIHDEAPSGTGGRRKAVVSHTITSNVEIHHSREVMSHREKYTGRREAHSSLRQLIKRINITCVQ